VPLLSAVKRQTKLVNPIANENDVEQNDMVDAQTKLEELTVLLHELFKIHRRFFANLRKLSSAELDVRHTVSRTQKTKTW
jgi:hypothetical protein